MAKVVMPLMSQSARNALGKRIVYFPWKGLTAVRTYVVPANPNTAAQQVQRTYLKTLVIDWRTLGFTALDRTALNAWALLSAKPMSGFNKWMSVNLLWKVAGFALSLPFNVRVTTPGAAQITVKVKVKGNVSDYATWAFFDTKQHGTLNKFQLGWDAGNTEYSGTIAGIGSGVTYWVYVEASKSGYEGAIGDYKKKTI